MKKTEMKKVAKETIEQNIDWLKSSLCKNKVEEYNNCIYYILELCLTTEMISYDEYSEYRRKCIDIIKCPFDL